eukprot:CAMPEP_0182528274 /NCGR_PEP_ID=MMETSP1323-20130603/4408_1 /TAXON_ID=236787 /ORGANISM="Florenciella parvula, Strain RCC1693" /LENGTH=234 /DNA_ID=CAMNT_0024737375 /DNA_START=105 /DNA_END=809 /DNA_ORIENTATION=-
MPMRWLATFGRGGALTHASQSQSSRAQLTSRAVFSSEQAPTPSFETAQSFEALALKGDGVMQTLLSKNETVGVAETSSGGLISASLLASPVGGRAYKGGGIRLRTGISESATTEAIEAVAAVPAEKGVSWGMEYADGEPSDTGAVRALELAHAAKYNLGTTWGIGESGVPGPGGNPIHEANGLLPGMGFVAVAGPTEQLTAVVKLDPSNATRGANMLRYANAALDLIAHLQTKP